MRGRYILSEVGKGLSRNKAMAVSVVIVTFVSLFFVGVAALAQMQVSMMKSQWYDKIEVSIYMCAKKDLMATCNQAEATQEQIDAVDKKLKSPAMSAYVKSVHFETKEEAYENFQKIAPQNPIVRWTKPDSLQAAFRVKLVDPQQYRFIEEEFAGTPGISEIKDQRDVVEPLFDVVDRAKMLSLGLAGVMIVAAVLLITTTIRLSAISREKETTIMRYVGASTLTIQLPFMIEGALAALTGAVLAVGALWGGLHMLVDNWLAPSMMWTNFVGVKHLLIVAPLLVLAAILLAAIASMVSLARYTKV
ncbi:permease-like cell division protein FtsX [Gleimia hominis]|uniref:Cell division protein FtsX n=1 Tax=Gleimia hominis TaxID=595468 RepID=A0ABU3IAC2_9ACTO|nr:permease-like cell division protein FtsX [Gleimia hominis]MDT3767321.1 permease-like cell division protein FtsX [Gleimia hominis]WIK64750.1 permease-like cell division protein FtsX [Gleimia hominis]